MRGRMIMITKTSGIMSNLNARSALVRFVVRPSELEKWPLSHRPRFIFVPKQVALSYILAALIRRFLDKS